METYELYQVAKDRNIPVILLAIPENGSMCIQSDGGKMLHRNGLRCS